MQTTFVLDKANPLTPAEDFWNLRREGISLIERLGHQQHTEYNSSDPGITILEALCFAITDAAYRMGFDMKDLLSPKRLEADTWDKVFYTARQILHNSPLTLNDYRKLIIDVEGVRNAWIEKSRDYEVPIYVDYKWIKGSENNPYPNPCDEKDNCRGVLTIKSEGITEGEAKGYYKPTTSNTTSPPPKILELEGIYNIIIELEEDVRNDKDKYAKATEEIQQLLHQNRNLGEDFLGISTVDYEPFTLDTALLIEESADPDEILAQIYNIIERYFSPRVRHYTIEELMLRGYAVDEIFEGPPLQHGFILDEELEKTDLFRDMHLSDILNSVHDIPGIKSILYFHLQNEDGDKISDYFNEWTEELKASRKTAQLRPERSAALLCKEREAFLYNQQQPETEARRKKVLRRLRDLKTQDKNYKLKNYFADFKIPQGENMEVEAYIPVQYALPICYGVNELEYWENGNKRDIERMQLRGFLLFFEQLLVGFHQQLAHLREFFSFDEEVNHSYHFSVLSQVNNLAELLMDNAEAFQIIDENKPIAEQEISTNLSDKEKEEINKAIKEAHDKILVQEEIIRTSFERFAQYLQKLTENEFTFLSRRNKALSHLLGRYAEDIREYEQMSRIFYPTAESLSPPPGKEEQSKDTAYLDESYPMVIEKKLIQDKINILADYPGISNERGKGMNYAGEVEVKEERDALLEDQDRDLVWDSSNVSGFERRLGRLLGFSNVDRRSLIPEFLAIEEIETGKFIVKILNPEEKEKAVVLITAEEGLKDPKIVEGKCCAEDLAIQILLQAENEKSYVLKDPKTSSSKKSSAKKMPEKNYSFFLLDTNGSDVLAFSENYPDAQKRDEAKKILINYARQINENEGMHLVEHILLRPKIDEVIPVETNGTLILDEPQGSETQVKLLDICLDACDTSIEGTNGTPNPYRFIIYRIPADKCFDDKPWVLALYEIKGANKINLLFELDPQNNQKALTFKNYALLILFLSQLRQVGGIEDNYLSAEAKKKEGFLLQVSNRTILLDMDKAVPTTKKGREDLIKTFTNFFSFQHEFYNKKDDCEKDICNHNEDPYSYKVTILLPCWVKRFQDKTYRNFVEKTIRRELPAHIHARIYWVGMHQMKTFEEAYREWLGALTNTAFGKPLTYNTVNTLVEQLNHIKECGCCQKKVETVK
ncbi:MAG: hypothetical protein NW226_18050 [Microscillaceae bacterium]|nr:hypothetical protein [Microscillaceae bacterium]